MSKLNYINSYKIFESSLKRYGVLYLTTCLPKGHDQEWINYYKIDSSPIPELKILIDQLNDKYKSVIYLPIDESIHPGCCSDPDWIENIANDLYDGFESIFNKKFGIGCIKLGWSIINLNYINDVKSLHHVGYSTLEKLNLEIVKFGRAFDKIKDPGMYFIKI